MNNCFKSFIVIILLFSFSTTSIAQNKEITICVLDGQVDLSDTVATFKDLHEISIISLENRRTFYLPNSKNGKINVPSAIGNQDIILQFIDDNDKEYSYLIPAFKKIARVYIDISINENCLSYVRYNGCDAMFLGEQYGENCEQHNFILLDFCSHSPTLIHPGNRLNHQYIEYSDYIDSMIILSPVYNQKLCDSLQLREEFTIPSKINNLELLLKNSRLKKNYKWRPSGRFEVKFLINCRGQVVGSKIVNNNTSISDYELLNLFPQNISFTPASILGDNVDSYSLMKFKLRGNQLKAIDK